MPRGKVKWFNDAKGYGFIDMGDGDEDIFVHYTDIFGGGFKTLQVGQQVEFELHEGPRGPLAKNVRPLNPAS